MFAESAPWPIYSRSPSAIFERFSASHRQDFFLHEEMVATGCPPSFKTFPNEEGGTHSKTDIPTERLNWPRGSLVKTSFLVKKKIGVNN